MPTVYFVLVLSDTQNGGKQKITWKSFGTDYIAAEIFAKGRGFQGRNAHIRSQCDTKTPPTQREICIHEMADYGNADRIYMSGGEYWAEYTCIHCGSTFTLWCNPMVGR